MADPQRSGSDADKITVSRSKASDKLVRRDFPGPKGASEKLRVAVEPAAYADLIAHAKESLAAEVCGVLAGQVCKDSEGEFVHVEAVIRGNSAAQAATHVTFTQATWDSIHQTLEQDHPKLRIVGWYHTHPGFGVEFSDMDIFIQQNFFPGPTQIALVTDPMNGAVAIVTNTAQGIEYLPRYWVHGREQQAKVPARRSETGETSSVSEAGADLTQTIRALETRINQLVQSNDEQRGLYHRVLLTSGLVFCLGVIAAAGYLVFNQYTSRLEPPRVNGYIPLPVKIGDKTVMIGVGIVEWDVPPELNSLMLQVEERKRQAAEKAAAEETKESPVPASPAQAKP